MEGLQEIDVVVHTNWCDCLAHNDFLSNQSLKLLFLGNWFFCLLSHSSIWSNASYVILSPLLGEATRGFMTQAQLQFFHWIIKTEAISNKYMSSECLHSTLFLTILRYEESCLQQWGVETRGPEGILMVFKSLVPVIKIPGAALILTFPKGDCSILHWLWELHQYPFNPPALLLKVYLHFCHWQPRALTSYKASSCLWFKEGAWGFRVHRVLNFILSQFCYP